MSDKTRLLDDFRRYAGLIAAALERPARFDADLESATAVQVERGGVFAQAVRDPQLTDAAPYVERLFDLAKTDRLAHLAVIDRGGHHRPAYRPLTVYACLQSFQIAYEMLPRSQFGRWEEGLRPWCDLLEAQLGDITWPTDNVMPAARGASATESAWSALALHVAGKIYVRDAWTDLASDTFGKLSRSQRDSGAFLHASPADNPETHWYHELVLLHAAASYAVQAEDRPVSAAVARNAAFHLRETQPDHATNQPWALFAFLWNSPDTLPMADGVLHAASAQNPSTESLLSFTLLADALYCIRLFL